MAKSSERDPQPRVRASRWHYRIARERAAIGRFADALAIDLIRAGVAESPRLALATVLDELLANVVMHAAEVRGPIHLRLRLCNGELVARLRYLATAFDPTARADPQRPTSIADARTGGVGIAMVRAMTREFIYRHTRGENHLRVRVVA